MTGRSLLLSTLALVIAGAVLPGTVLADGPAASGVVRSEIFNPERSGLPPAQDDAGATGGAAAAVPAASDPSAGVVKAEVFIPPATAARVTREAFTPETGAPTGAAPGVEAAAGAAGDDAGAPEALVEAEAAPTSLPDLSLAPREVDPGIRWAPATLPNAGDNLVALSLAALWGVILASGMTGLGILCMRRVR